MKLSGKVLGGWSVLALLALGGTAMAQEAAAMATPSTGGNGFKVGSGRLHPYFHLETRVDSGAGYFPPDESTTPEDLSPELSGEVAMRFRPGFRLEIPSSTLALNLDANLEYVLFTGLVTERSGAASHLQGAADLTARLNPDAPLSLELSNQFVRSDRSRTAALGIGILSLFNETRVKVPWRPGGGAVELTPSAGYALELFQPLSGAPPRDCTEAACNPLLAEQFDYGDLRFALEGRWRFLPKTALVVDTGLDLRSYFNDGSSPKASLLRAMLGVAGLVSPRIAVVAKAGWGQDLAASGAGTFVAQLEGTYLFSPTMSFKGGYLRRLEPVAAYGVFTDNRGYLDARALLGGKLTLRAGGAVDFLSFSDERTDTLISLDMGPEYQLRPWLTVAAGYMLGARSSSLEGRGLNFARHEGYLRLSAMY